MYLDDCQRTAVLAALDDTLSFWTGGPGTGKTASVIAVVDMFLNQGISSIALCATTGMAALNLQNAFVDGGRPKLKKFIEEHPPQTVHALLKPSPYKYTYHPLEVNVLICDEFSMADTFLASTLLWALASGTRVRREPL